MATKFTDMNYYSRDTYQIRVWHNADVGHCAEIAGATYDMFELAMMMQNIRSAIRNAGSDLLLMYLASGSVSKDRNPEMFADFAYYVALAKKHV